MLDFFQITKEGEIMAYETPLMVVDARGNMHTDF